MRNTAAARPPPAPPPAPPRRGRWRVTHRAAPAGGRWPLPPCCRRSCPPPAAPGDRQPPAAAAGQKGRGTAHECGEPRPDRSGPGACSRRPGDPDPEGERARAHARRRPGDLCACAAAAAAGGQRAEGAGGRRPGRAAGWGSGRGAGGAHRFLSAVPASCQRPSQPLHLGRALVQELLLPQRERAALWGRGWPCPQTHGSNRWSCQNSRYKQFSLCVCPTDAIGRLQAWH